MPVTDCNQVELRMLSGAGVAKEKRGATELNRTEPAGDAAAAPKRLSISASRAEEGASS